MEAWGMAHNIPQILSTYTPFLRASNELNRLGWPTTEPQRSTCLYSQHWTEFSTYFYNWGVPCSHPSFLTIKVHWLLQDGDVPGCPMVYVGFCCSSWNRQHTNGTGEPERVPSSDPVCISSREMTVCLQLPLILTLRRWVQVGMTVPIWVASWMYVCKSLPRCW